MLSPLLFLIYINDIPVISGAKLCLYADDTALLVSSPNKFVVFKKLKLSLQALESWFRNWNLRLHRSKSSAILFRCKNTTKNTALSHASKIGTLQYEGTPIPWCSTVKYLGVYLSDNLSFNAHLNYIINRVNSQTRTFYSLISPCSRLSLKNRLLILKAFFWPLFTYAFPVWLCGRNNCRTKLLRLQQLFRGVTRRILNCPYYIASHILFNDLKLPTFFDRAQTLISSFQRQIDMCPNPTLHQALSEQHIPYAKFVRLKNISLNSFVPDHSPSSIHPLFPVFLEFLIKFLFFF